MYQEQAAEFLPILLELMPRNQNTSNDPLYKGERVTSELGNLNQESPYCWTSPMTSATGLSLLLSFRQTSPYSVSNDGPADKQTCTAGHKQGLININTHSLSDMGHKLDACLGELYFTRMQCLFCTYPTALKSILCSDFLRSSGMLLLYVNFQG